ncbi:MAG: hypothetical protein HC839_04415 [Leptolyngbyaceae cyanobacterium RM2_2_21]|nr:hypothetical protein [Leptolyngbyaceae cyanobacterium RM2_2_21]NJN02528.1 hypothetical protein [Leptolyngbyaceae cyanobacterium RM1_1_2]
MALKLRNLIRNVTDPLEAKLLADHYFSLQQYLSYCDKLGMLLQSLSYRLASAPKETQPEIIFFLYSKACERLLIPLLLHLQQQPKVRTQVRLSLIVLRDIHQLQLSSANVSALAAADCSVQSNYFSLIRTCTQPEKKLVVMCLDHRSREAYHHAGTKTADKLRQHGAKTLSIQHGGTRQDSVKDLSTAASDVVLVWGQRVYRELVEQYGVEQGRLRLVGNPLHDRLAQVDPVQVRVKLLSAYPNLRSQLPGKKIILLATTVQAEYADQPNEQALYREYLSHIYQSIDFSNALLLVKMHPLDSLSPNLYQEMIPANGTDSIIVIEPSLTELDVYSLLSIADLLITRASTVAEEALIMQRSVIAFDLKPEGPSQGYKHLEEYGSYTTVYSQPTDQLKNAIATALTSKSASPATSSQALDTVADLTYRLDGQSTARAVEAILQELGSSTAELPPLPQAVNAQTVNA